MTGGGRQVAPEALAGPAGLPVWVADTSWAQQPPTGRLQRLGILRPQPGRVLKVSTKPHRAIAVRRRGTVPWLLAVAAGLFALVRWGHPPGGTFGLAWELGSAFILLLEWVGFEYGEPFDRGKTLRLAAIVGLLALMAWGGPVLGNIAPLGLLACMLVIFNSGMRRYAARRSTEPDDRTRGDPGT